MAPLPTYAAVFRVAHHPALQLVVWLHGAAINDMWIGMSMPSVLEAPPANLLCLIQAPT